ncbi:MAG: CRISPR-associated protein Cas6 [Bacteroidetes bacterium]|nr:MAG: CRISPR-associated protein Cas6 [Bacteroidota bacterium]
MRIQLHFSPNYYPLPFNHLHFLTGALHKWLGPNEEHDGLSLYSFGWLKGGEKVGAGLMFPNGARLNISFFNSENGWRLAKGILEDTEWKYGMRVQKAMELPFPRFGSSARFLVDGGIVLRKKRPDGSRQYLKWDDAEADAALTRIFRRKLRAAGFEGPHLEASMGFDRSYPKPYFKKISIKETEHICSICPVWVKGSPEALRFAWLTGAGELTGSGFGALI